MVQAVVDANPRMVDLVFENLVGVGLADTKVGRPGMTAEQVLFCIVLKQINGWSYDELSFHLVDSQSCAAFCRFGIGEALPRRATLHENIKALRAETLEAINRVLVGFAREEGIEDGRMVRTDCTVVEANIHPPSDSWLLRDGVEVLTRMMDRAALSVDFRWADRTKKAKRRALEIINAKDEARRKPLYQKLLSVAGEVVDFAKRAVAALHTCPVGRDVAAWFALQELAQEITHYVGLVRRVIDQTERRVLRGEQVEASQKIVSIFEEHTDIIVKDRREVLYGHKIALTAGASSLVLDARILRGNPADSNLAVSMIERQIEIYGQAPEQTAMDGGFASKANVKALKDLGVVDASFSKRRGIPVEDMVRDSTIYRMLFCFRAGIEGVISFLKRGFGLGRCLWSGIESFGAYVWSSILAANLVTLARARLARAASP
jgi:IS5 family transposase